MFNLEAKLRDSIGKGPSRRARIQGLVPAVIYGKEKTPVSIVLDHNKVIKCANDDNFFREEISLIIDGKEEKVKIQAVQRHPYKPKFMHLDFIRV